MMRLVLLQLGFLIQGFFAIDPLIDNGYRNVIVSIHPDINVDANSQQTIISNIKVRKICEITIQINVRTISWKECTLLAKACM